MTVSSDLNFARAHLLIGSTPTRMNCWFNPTTLVRRRGARWKDDKPVAAAAQKPQYLGGRGETITLNLLLHAEDEPGRGGKAVEQRVEALLALVEATQAEGTKSRPPTVTLVWGNFTSCEMVTESVDATIELFDIDGTPLRAIVNLSLNQYEPEPGQAPAAAQNPTTRALLARRAHAVAPGENVHLVAFEHLRDPARWSQVAAFNELDDPLRVQPGDILVVPARDA